MNPRAEFIIISEICKDLTRKPNSRKLTMNK